MGNYGNIMVIIATMLDAVLLDAVIKDVKKHAKKSGPNLDLVLDRTLEVTKTVTAVNKKNIL